ncbi:PE family protein [Mycobacterium haemophilum DSM 44634]|uniref:PE domain-containing protein n=1 Tax=Mycobacterium haemophilum TaxID=29311 RepID=UPI000655C31B|nr:PE domain-containing protein [Mycobacterium haemophilum]AKN16240.1 hypothetical protein B586_06180 [Mycobacterium haemophilum DSM 44634]MCV7339778.1 PE family protein [Mycobacterium haemophilum DSM 44634]
MSFLATSPEVLNTAVGTLRGVADEINTSEARTRDSRAKVEPPSTDEVSIYAAQRLRDAAADCHMALGGGSVILELFLTALSQAEQQYSNAETTNAKSIKFCALM